MFMEYSVSQLKGVGPKRVEQFERLDIYTIYDLLHFYPRSYQDWSNPVTIFGAELSEEKVCVRATVRTASSRFRARSGITVFETKVFDATATMKVVIFNNKYAAAKLEPGKEYLFYGKVTLDGNLREMLSPDIEDVGEKSRIRPVYRTTKNMSSKYIEGCMEKALSQYGSFAEESLPYDLREQYGLLSLKEALQEIHFPSSMKRVAEARR
ncbi:MAG: ATP-dependent DNA helicase RecG, partial [Clostridia bacterium]|nr:ATP-dependent DNA helicase RecG [Clostridia bacterium]